MNSKAYWNMVMRNINHRKLVEFFEWNPYQLEENRVVFRIEHGTEYDPRDVALHWGSRFEAMAKKD